MTEESSIDFRSKGGTNGKEYDNLLNHKELDYLFCVNKDLNMWLIPTSELPNQNTIRLRVKPNTNNQGFQSNKYLVTF